ncbi:MAG: tryptophan--tRNA ligase [Deltaproteobacteria bacterium]|nr:tryptophan--tRNA ligase [Deltaproteobacteria bacterium]
MKKRVLSGMQSTGKLHIGNYHGALEHWVRLQDDYNCYFFVANYHSLTTLYQNSKEIYENTLQVAIDFLAAGIEPDKSVVFVQSLVPAHTELHLILSMFTPISWLERVPSYKEKMSNIELADLTTYGFLGYPVLQTADIVLYDANFVPVGEDQLPHLELAREIVRRINHYYGETFVEPLPLLTSFSRIPGIDGRKMSKSYDNAIFLGDTDEQIRSRIMNAITDPARIKRSDPGHPEVCNIFAYHRIYSSSVLSQIESECRMGKRGCVDCKKECFKNLIASLATVRERRYNFEKNKDYVKDILRDGSKKASEYANKVLNRLREKMGIIY